MMSCRVSIIDSRSPLFSTGLLGPVGGLWRCLGLESPPLEDAPINATILVPRDPKGPRCPCYTACV